MKTNPSYCYSWLALLSSFLTCTSFQFLILLLKGSCCFWLAEKLGSNPDLTDWLSGKQSSTCRMWQLPEPEVLFTNSRSLRVSSYFIMLDQCPGGARQARFICQVGRVIKKHILRQISAYYSCWHSLSSFKELFCSDPFERWT